MISFVREYESIGMTWYDIIYKKDNQVSKVRTVRKENLPKTVINFINNANTIKDEYDIIFHRPAKIYEK